MIPIRIFVVDDHDLFRQGRNLPQHGTGTIGPMLCYALALLEKRWF